MALNVTTAAIASGANTAIAQPSLAQWDQGQILKIEGVELPESYQVEFSGGGTVRTVPMIGTAEGVQIPNKLLQSSHPITAHVVLHESTTDRETEYWITIYVKPRQAPETVEIDPADISIIDQTIAAAQQAVATSTAQAEAAAGSAEDAAAAAEAAEASAQAAAGSASAAASSARSAGASAVEADQAKTAAETAQAAAEAAQAAAEQEVTDAQAAGSQAVEEIDEAKAAGIQAIDAEAATQINQVGRAGATQIRQINELASNQMRSIENKTTQSIGAIEDARDAAIEDVQTEGQTQTAAAQAQAQAAASSASAAANSASAAAGSASAAATARTGAETAAASVSASAAQIAQNASDITDLNRQISDVKIAIDILPDVALSWTTSSYLNYRTGEEASSASYAYAKISLPKIPLLSIKTMAKDPAGICFYDANGDFLLGISGVSATDLHEYVINPPDGAEIIGISCIMSARGSVTIQAKIADQIPALYSDKQSLATINDVQQIQLAQGIVNRNLTIYNPDESYTGRYASIHLSAGDIFLFDGYSVNYNYPAIVVSFNDGTKDVYFATTATRFVDEKFVMPKDGTIFVNGNTLYYPIIKLQRPLTEAESASVMRDVFFGRDFTVKAKIADNGVLSIKKRLNDSQSICISWGHVGGNSLFGFQSFGLVAETPGDKMSDSFEITSSVHAETTDWFSPYCVKAVNNADGDVPDGNGYFTGGNHRTTNTATGGGITAVEESLVMLFGGVSPLKNVVYNSDEIIVKWSNLVQANNTSKADGTGRAVLRETWTMTIDESGVHVENDIDPLEDVTLVKYYGLQAYMPEANVIYVGGAIRTPVAINSASNSGNKTCREAILFDSSICFRMEIDAVDLGLFSAVSYGLLTTSASKLYGHLIDQDLLCESGEHYFVRGSYKFW